MVGTRGERQRRRDEAQTRRRTKKKNRYHGESYGIGRTTTVHAGRRREVSASANLDLGDISVKRTCLLRLFSSACAMSIALAGVYAGRALAAEPPGAEV